MSVDPRRTRVKVAIIGGGIAGIAAANWLANDGFTDFVLVEATERLGGRIWSIDLGMSANRVVIRPIAEFG